MPCSLTRHALLMSLTWTFLGCVTSAEIQKIEARLAALKKENDDNYQRARYLRDQISALQQSFTNFRNQYFRDKNCKNPKLAEFMTAVAHNDPQVCRAVEFDKALLFMKSQPNCIVYLHPSSGLSSLHPARTAFLSEDLLKREQLSPSSRLLILVQPHGESEAERDIALTVAKSLQWKIQSELLPAEFRSIEVLGPHLLPCNLRNEATVQRLYNNDIAIMPLRGEPEGKQPRIRIWIFRSDC
ncbi:MAG: hypothetical protein JNJ46_09230 [Myxococcales bacterium]|nr:hypothetical protein [Myxococcales bacterium]